MKKKSRLTITPSDSKNEDFTLSLVDYFYKELANRGITSNKKASYLEVNLPKKYEDKYDMLVIDCDNGKVYLRGSECKDKHFGKLSKFNPQRKSDAYNCVNYSVTRLVNRINKLVESLNNSTEKTAAVKWLKQEYTDGTEDFFAFTDNEEEVLEDAVLNSEIDPEKGTINIIETDEPEDLREEVKEQVESGEIEDLRDLDDLITDQYECTGRQQMIIAVPEGVDPQTYIENVVNNYLLDTRTANYAWIREDTEDDSFGVLWIDNNDLITEEYINEIYDDMDLDTMDLRNLEIEFVDDAAAEQEAVVETLNDVAEQSCHECENCTCDDLDQQIDSLLNFEKNAKAKYVHYFPNKQSKIDKFLEENPKFKELENEYGKCTNVYKDCVTYEKLDADFPDDEVKSWCGLWNHVIENRFVEWMSKQGIEIRKSNIDFDKDNASITVWRSANDKKEAPDDIPDYVTAYKQFFSVKMKGNKTVEVDFDGNVKKITYSPDDELIRFEYQGYKY